MSGHLDSPFRGEDAAKPNGHHRTREIDRLVGLLSMIRCSMASAEYRSVGVGKMVSHQLLDGQSLPTGEDERTLQRVGGILYSMASEV